MKSRFTLLLIVVAFLLPVHVIGQSNQQVRDTIKPPLLPVYNAGFDVIIKHNGDIVHGLVEEVGLHFIKYKRTDIPDGPVYTIPRFEVYAISYRNQVKEILTNDVVDPGTQYYRGGFYGNPYNLRRPDFFKEGAVRVGLGFIRTATRVSNAEDYSSKPTFPMVSIAYDVNYLNRFRPGVQIAFGNRKFSGQQFSSYDSTQSSADIKESNFTLHLYARYHFLKGTSAFQPYVIGGLGLRTSKIRSEFDISFINNPDKVVQVQSGSNSVGVGILARIGTDYFFNQKFSVFGDIGAGPSLLNFGITASVN